MAEHNKELPKIAEIDELGNGTKSEVLSSAQRARIERNRLKARALRDARLVQRPNTDGGPRPAPAPDTGGGFLPDEEAAPAQRPVAPPAPIVDPTERPHCQDCERPFAQSYLFDTFGHPVCDECRDDDGAHALVTRTEARAAFLLKDCDLDLRPPPLRCVRRRNPHGSRLGDMRLYLRAQVEERARLVWGSERALEEERERREEARARSRHNTTARRLRALRMDVRSSLFDRTRALHTHDFGPERYDEAADQYSRVCTDCGHVETYEKM
ncbi:DNA repair protein complementing XP-A cells homolog [Trichoplusia ni]|uniref:DNA repair protein complementing XP-A cells homolog n=1 Tax=Trichoplusia ni TaxID=7111 RepID=A0A7E5WAQ7_TRINI|nr:DNA repair protein complementing XP-A cells homolog [Trichoplusia ni]